jgi:hypothetical protein
VPATGGATGPAVATPLPPRDVLLERVLPERQKLYRLVRRMLDELDEAAPWDHLYYPPDDGETFLAMASALVGVVEQIPQRTRELVELLSLAAPDDETRLTLQEAEFYFSGIHSMCARDLGRLRELLEPHAVPGAPPLRPGDRNFLCEVAADLKGKYASALMGATASIVGEGSWSGVDVEPVLFPEKAEEFRRNGELAMALRRTLDAVREVQEAVPFVELLERWRAGARVDPYALADLATFRGILGRLLKRELRRAFYSGDYHQISRREASLAMRIAAVEALHHRTWSEPADTPGAADAYAELEALTLEVAAILDVKLLERLVGARVLKDLRMAVASQSADVEEGRSRRKRLADRLERLVPLLGGEDLTSFLGMLLGSVLKRASLASLETGAHLMPAPEKSPERDEAPRPAAAAKSTGGRRKSGTTGKVALPRIEEDELPSIGDALPSIGEVVAPNAAPRPLPAATTQTQSAASATPPAARRETLDQLHTLLQSLQSNANPHWSSFRMLQRLLERHARIPPSIVQGAHPFVYDVLNGLVPQLEVAASFQAVPQEARRRLVECCLALTDDALSPEQMIDEVPANLSRLHRLLEALTAATAAQLRALP